MEGSWSPKYVKKWPFGASPIRGVWWIVRIMEFAFCCAKPFIMALVVHLCRGKWLCISVAIVVVTFGALLLVWGGFGEHVAFSGVQKSQSQGHGLEPVLSGPEGHLQLLEDAADVPEATGNLLEDTQLPKLDSKAPRAAMALIIEQAQDLLEAQTTIRSVQERFNGHFGYDWVIVYHRDIGSSGRKAIVASAAGAKVRFVLPIYLGQLVGYRRNTDKALVGANRRKTELPPGRKAQNSVQSRHYARFAAGHFYNLPVWDDYDYYWKMPIGGQLACDVGYDVFDHMQKEDIRYGWLLVQQDPENMAPSLMQQVLAYTASSANNLMEGDQKKTTNNLGFILAPTLPEDHQTYRGCSFGGGFELASLAFFRSPQYQHFFNHIDSLNGIYYETWTEAAIKTVATSLFLETGQTHFFGDLAVSTPGQGNCPINKEVFLEGRCSCDPQRHGKAYLPGRRLIDTVEEMHLSRCVAHWLDSVGKKMPPSLEGPGTFFDISSTGFRFGDKEKEDAIHERSRP